MSAAVISLDEHRARLKAESNDDLERRLLAGLFGGIYDLATVSHIVDADDFARTSHMEIWTSITNVVAAGQPVDDALVTNDLRLRGVLERVGDETYAGADYLQKLLALTASTYNPTAYARAIRLRALDRRTSAIARTASLRAVNASPTEAIELLRRAADEISTLCPSGEDELEKIIELGENYPAQESAIDWLTKGLLLAPGRPALFVGTGGVGKTYVVQAITIGLVNGAAALGGLVGEGPVRRVLHIDTDQGKTATRRRYRRLAAGMGLAKCPDLLALSDLLAARKGFDPKDGKGWRRLFKRYDLAVVDALAGLLSTCGLDENAAADTRGVLDAIQYASDAEKCTALVIAHTGKDQRDESGRKVQQKDPRGSSAIRQAAGVIWAFTGDTERGAVRTASRERDPADDDGDDELLSSFCFRIEVAAVDTPGLRRMDGRNVAGLVVTRAGPPARRSYGAAPEDLRVAILAAVGRGGLTSQRGVEGAVTGNDKVKRAVLAQLCRDRVVMRRPDGEFFLGEGAASDAAEVR